MSGGLDSAKNAVKSFLSKDGKHDTTVHTTSSPAVTNETVEKHRHDNVIKATDKEVHQDHYHTTVQPVHDTQRLKEQHHFNTAAVEERKFEHGDDKEVQRRLQDEQAKFQDTTREGKTTHTTSTGGNLASEHVHHHVHENIQPVIQRQTVEPHVVHTTVPVHETHHNAAEHHSTTALPAVSLEQFKSQGGSLGGSKKTTEFFEGEPRAGHHHGANQSSHPSGEFRETGHHSGHTTGTTGTGLTGSHHTGTTGTSGTGLTGSHHTSTTSTSGTGLTGSHHTGTTGTSGAGLTGSHHTGTTGTDSGLTGSQHTSTTAGHHGTTGDHHTSTTKPSLIDRLNPMKDADGDGKKGLMD